jgi:hypothetical protein
MSWGAVGRPLFTKRLRNSAAVGAKPLVMRSAAVSKVGEGRWRLLAV